MPWSRTWQRCASEASISWDRVRDISACGWIGQGRLAEPAEVVAAVRMVLRPAGDLVGRCVLVTAGPTYEDVDPVRYVGNRSSGRMGLAIAAEAVTRGARVILVLGPVGLEPPPGAEVVRVRSAAEMRVAVMEHAANADAVIMAAAVADYTVRGAPGRRSWTKTPRPSP